MVVLVLFGLSFLATGIELRDNAVRTTATIVNVREVPDGRAGSHYEFTLEFTDLEGNQRTEETDQVGKSSVTPSSGDHIDIYYASNDPANLSDVRYGSPGGDDFFVATMFGISVIETPIIAHFFPIIRKRLRARRRQKLIP